MRIAISSFFATLLLMGCGTYRPMLLKNAEVLVRKTAAKEVVAYLEKRKYELVTECDKVSDRMDTIILGVEGMILKK